MAIFNSNLGLPEGTVAIFLRTGPAGHSRAASSIIFDPQVGAEGAPQGRTNGPIGHKKVPKRINIQESCDRARDRTNYGF